MKPLRLVAAIAAAGLISALSVAAAAVPAAAAPVHASSSNAVQLSQAKAPSPAINNSCRFHRDQFTTYYGGCGRWINWSCHLGNAHILNPTPQYASNDCGNGVMLFQNPNLTGRTLCLRPGSRTGILRNPWRSFRVEIC